MCLILDTNKYSNFLDPKDENMAPVRKWLNKNGGKLVYTDAGKFTEELKKKSSQKMKEWFERRLRINSDQVKLINSEEVKKKEGELKSEDLKSNDAHIIALALVGEVKLLISEDQKLHRDFTNKKIVAGGKVYQTKKHQHLLTKDTCP